MTFLNKMLSTSVVLILFLSSSLYGQTDGREEVINSDSDSSIGSEKLSDEESWGNSEAINDSVQGVEINQDSGLLELNPSRTETPNSDYLRSKGAGNNPGPSGNGAYDVGSYKHGTMPQEIVSDSASNTRDNE